MLKRMKSILAVVLVMSLLAISGSVFAFDYGSIPSSKMPPNGWIDRQWWDPGSWTTINVTTQGLPANDSSVDASLKVANIISTTTGNRILYFPAGTYYFKTNLQITADNIRLKGADMGSTTFQIEIPSTDSGGIKFVGSDTGSEISVTSDIALGANTITVSDASTIAVGDYIRLYAKNKQVNDSMYCFGQILKVIAKSSNTLTVDMKMGLAYTSSDTPVIQKFDPAKNVGISHVKVYRANDCLDYSGNIVFNRVVNGYVTDLESSYAPNNHIALYMSKDCVVERTKVHHSYDYGAGSHGYGIYLNYLTTNCRITDNKLWELRHHIIFYAGANHNVVSYNSTETGYVNTNNSINFHGYYPNNNLIEGNYGKSMNSDDSHGDNGPRNTWFRNRATTLVGSEDTGCSEHNIIGNFMYSLATTGSNHYTGANMKSDGTMWWGSLSSSSTIPASLYLTAKPSFFGSSKPWPIYGPGLTDFGKTNTLPAYDRAQ